MHSRLLNNLSRLIRASIKLPTFEGLNHPLMWARLKRRTTTKWRGKHPELIREIPARGHSKVRAIYCLQPASTGKGKHRQIEVMIKKDQALGIWKRNKARIEELQWLCIRSLTSILSFNKSRRCLTISVTFKYLWNLTKVLVNLNRGDQELKDWKRTTQL